MINKQDEIDRPGLAVRVRFIDRDGNANDIEAPLGDTLMRVAKRNLIIGIDGDCCGNCACGTCHMRIVPAKPFTFAPPNPIEAELLAFIGGDLQLGCRLGCQVEVSSELEGATIIVAKS